MLPDAWLFIIIPEAAPHGKVPSLAKAAANPAMRTTAINTAVSKIEEARPSVCKKYPSLIPIL
jgi:hypothetical protein